jgi:hypothetical protein
VPERPPTATQALAEGQDTPLNTPPFGGFGTCWIDQEVPFHASATGVERLAGLKVSPTAMQNVREAHDTPTSSVCRAPGGLGVCRTDHEAPFHTSASVTFTPARLIRHPTATHAVGEVHETAARFPPLIRGLGVGCTAQLVARAECAGAAATVGGLASPADGTVAAPAAGTAPAASARTTPAIPAVRPAAVKAGLRAGSRPLLSDTPWLII